MPPPVPSANAGTSLQLQHLTPTSTTCLRLAQLLPYYRWQYNIYFDSFFSNITLFATLRGLGIGAYGTACKNQVPAELQEYDHDHPKPEWNDLASVSHNNVLCMRWQDNARVFMMTTIHDLNDGVVTNRRRSRKGIPAVRKVFGEDIRKLLTIPLIIVRK